VLDAGIVDQDVESAKRVSRHRDEIASRHRFKQVVIAQRNLLRTGGKHFLTCRLERLRPSMPLIMIRQPCPASDRAMALPMPEVDPVTRAVRPVNVLM
jgi:hypothetical protein